MTKCNTKLNRIMRSAGLLVCILLALLLMSQMVFAADKAKDKESARKAVDPVGDQEHYSAVVYDNENGMPASVANAIAETEEGFIWIGSYGGLIRYDGTVFERIDSSSGIRSVGCLEKDSQGRLWIGTNEDGAALMEQGKFKQFTEEDGMCAAKVRDLEEGADGIMYAGTISGISLIYPDYHVEKLEHPKLNNVYVQDMEANSKGKIYGLSSEGDLFTIKKNKVISYTDHSKTHIEKMTCIRPDVDNPDMIYIGTEGSEIYYCKAGKNPSANNGIDISPLQGAINLKQIDGKLWVCAHNGIGVIDKKGFHYLKDVPFKYLINHVIKDYQGNLWFSSSRQGVMKISRNRFSNLFVHYNIPEQVVNCTCILGDDLYVGMETGLAVIGKKGKKTSLPITEAKYASGKPFPATDLLELLDGVRIRSFTRDRKNRIWIATWQSMGLLRYDHGKLTIFDEDNGLPSDRIRVADENPDGSLLVACTSGVSVIKGDRVVKNYGEKDGIKTKETLTVCTAPNGDMLVGSNGDGIYVIGKDKVQSIGRKDGLTSGVIMHIYHDSKRKVFWLITGNSIAYMTEDDYKITTVKDFPYSDNLDMFEDKDGDMWVLSSDGIYVASADKMLKGGKFHYNHYSMANGLPGIAVSNSFSDMTPNGDLYISANTGVVKVNINEPDETASDIKQAVPFIDADGERYYPDEHGEFTVPSSTKKITIYGYVFNYTLSDPLVTLQLEGFDRKPLSFRQSEMHPMIYTNLRGGIYKFIMTLKDESGNDTEQMSVIITKQKALSEQVWLYILSAMMLMAVMFLFAKLYNRRKVRELEKKHRMEAERERVSSELQMANRIQLGTLPHEYPPFPDRYDFRIFASMEPAREVGGDFYDYFLIDDDHLCMVIADVSGKGVPAALYMMNAKVFLQSLAKAGMSVEEIMSKGNDAICENNPMEMFITVWIGILELSTGKLVAANAGHEYPVVKRADGKFELFKEKHGFVLGGMKGMEYQEYELLLKPGDKVFVYTDGLPEATNEDLEMFGIGRVVSNLNEHPDDSPQQLLKNMHEAVNGFVKDAEQFDDLTMLCVEYIGEDSWLKDEINNNKM